MCGIRETVQMSRRQWLQTTGAAAAATMIGGLATGTDAKATGSKGSHGRPRHGGDKRPEEFAARVVLLGTAAGPLWWPGGGAGTGSAVVVDGDVYVVDCGEGVWRQYRELIGPGSPQETFTTLRALFITHAHSDHTVDFSNLLVFGPHVSMGRPEPLAIFGPGDRGSLPPLFGDAPAPPVINPNNPTPGIEDMTQMLIDAYAADFNDRMRDTRAADPGSVFEAHDIPLPASVVANANADPAPELAPFEIYSDEKVRVTATLARHVPTFPAFAFRFDTEHGSVVFSGDTAPEPNVVALAQGADVLVHEVIDPQWVVDLFPDPSDPAQAAAISHLLVSHTSIEDVGKVATEAGVDTLVLSHLAPGNHERRRWYAAARNFDGRLVVGYDGAQVGIGARARRGRHDRG